MNLIDNISETAIVYEELNKRWENDTCSTDSYQFYRQRELQEAMKEAGLPEPIFSMDESFFTVEFKRPQKNDPVNSSNDPINDPTNSQNDPTNLEDVVFGIISNGEGISAPEISKLISKSLKTTKRYIAKLRESGKIEFRGALKTSGYYLINKDWIS